MELLTRAQAIPFPPEKRQRIIEDNMKIFPELTREQIAQTVDQEHGGEVWMNHKYQVKVWREYPVHITIKLLSKKACHDWRDFQAIKNQLVGPECEGVELYPAESRLVDVANQYHIFVFPNPNHRFPFGFQTRKVSYESSRDSKQRRKT